eukprot:m.237027 g.237027  ORF g.237027 m.237027 type:complete len:358 (-) comp17416_c0_seq12:8211-9284(-)
MLSLKEEPDLDATLTSSDPSALSLNQRLDEEDKDTVVLELENSDIVDIPPQLFAFVNVEELYLSDNELDAIPADLFTALPNLRHLDLRYNVLSFLPEVIGYHAKLESLLLGHNQLTSLPVELGYLSTLSTLNLNANPLYFPPSDVLQQGVTGILGFLAERAGPRNPAFVTEVDISGFTVAVSEAPSSVWSEAEEEEQVLDVSGVVALEVTSATPTPSPDPCPLPAEPTETSCIVDQPTVADLEDLSQSPSQSLPSNEEVQEDDNASETDEDEDDDGSGNDTSDDSSNDDTLPLHQPVVPAANIIIPDRSPTPIDVSSMEMLDQAIREKRSATKELRARSAMAELDRDRRLSATQDSS